VERKTLYTVIARLEGKHADLLALAALKSMQTHKDQVHTITFDNGLEFACHEQIAAGVGADIYLCPLGTSHTLTALGNAGRMKTPTG
jgi:transposase, IS30 family